MMVLHAFSGLISGLVLHLIIDSQSCSPLSEINNCQYKVFVNLKIFWTSFICHSPMKLMLSFRNSQLLLMMLIYRQEMIFGAIFGDLHSLTLIKLIPIWLVLGKCIQCILCYGTLLVSPRERCSSGCF
jgi:hypothetical protein